MNKDNKIISTLNKEQIEASRAPFGNNLILAGAGTGKTSTIVARVIYLLEKKSLNPKDIILLTFTSKASREMKERLGHYVDEEIVKQISISTYHSLCLSLIKKYHSKSKLLNDSQAKFLLQTTYSRIVNFENEGFYKSNTLYPYFDNYLNSLSSHSFGDWMRQEVGIDNSYFLEQYEIIFNEYREDKLRHGLLSFIDLLLVAKKFFNENTNNIKEIIVDEFQDTNPLQNSILQEINPNSLFCVGDYDQSIYSFNGADLNIISDFGEKSNFNLYNLKKNYRSQKLILSIAEKLISNNPRIYPKELEIMVSTKNDVYPCVISYDSVIEQYLGVTSFIRSTISSKKSNESIAVLFRTNSSVDGMELALRDAGIGFVKNDKSSFMDNHGIQMIICIFKLSLFGNLDFLEFGILMRYLVKSDNQSIIESYYKFLTQNGSVGLLDGLKSDKGKLTSSKGEFNSDSESNIVDLIRLLSFSKKSPSFVIKSFMESQYYASSVNAIAREKGKGNGVIVEKIVSGCDARIKAFLKISQRHTNSQKFYEKMTKPTKERDGEIDNDKVNLLTVHSSKGLEFHHVYVVDVDDESFPNKKLMKNPLDYDEERRLFYVGITRAIKELTFSYSLNSKSKKKRNKPSRFLSECELI